jgi:nitrate/nitrite transport system ATP-binding protein
MDVPLERPRNRIALAEDHTYNHCRQEILSFLYEKQRKVEPISARTPGSFGRKEKVAA